MNRSDLTRIDTAISSHYYDAAGKEMNFVVQNRSGLAITGLSLKIESAGNDTTLPIPPLAAGATTLVRLPVDAGALAPGTTQQFSTQLINPAGLVDAVPANNRRSSVLSPSGKQP
jgi:hypothetical protein